MIAETKTKAKGSTKPKRGDHVRARQVMADVVEPLGSRPITTIGRQAVPEVNELLQDEHIVPIDVRLLDRHPLNRTIDANTDEIRSLRDSIVAHGQREPMRVRAIGDRYQILSGERRYTALVSAGIGYARCIIVVADDAAALAEVAIANSHRQDLNPIERAQLMQHLTEQGGMSLLEAGKVFGLTSESGCKNALRMLRLPPKIRDLITSGQLPERVARRLIPYMVTDEIAKAIADDLTSQYYGDENMVALWQDELGWIEETLRDLVRPLSPEVTYSYGYPKGQHAALFDWQDNPKLIEQLKIVELPWSIDFDPKTRKDRIEPRKFATNVKLWHKLNDPLVEAAIEKGKSKQKGAKGTKDSPEPKKQTPAQLAADAKRKAQEAERRLDTFSREWLCRLLRCSLADRSTDDELVAHTLPWIVGQCPGHDIREAHEQAIIECQIALPKSAKAHSWMGRETIDLLSSIPKTKVFDVQNALWCVLLWPVTRLIGDDAKKSKLTPAGCLPEKLIPFGYSDELGHLLKLCSLTKNVSAEAAWHEGATDGADQRRLISVWLCRHTKDQLHKLRSELNVSEGSSTMGRDELAGCVLNAHRPGKPLPLPKRLKALTTTK